MADLTRTTVYVDVNGFTRSALLTTTAGAGGIQTAILAVSDADMLDWWEGTLNINPSPAPVNSPFNSVKDAALLNFATTGTSLLQVTLPAPKASIFFGDLETVNPASIAALIAAVVGTAKTQTGLTATAFVSGTRRRN